VLDLLFPTRADNDYRGHPIALWVFVPITLITLVRSCIHIFAPDGGAQSIATIPLDTMTSGGAQGVVTIFALWGLSQLLLGFVYVVVLWRYRALVPLMYLLVLVEYAGRMAIGAMKPIASLETPPGATANPIFITVALVMLVLATREASPSEATVSRAS
jgi:hypothetical protein